MIFVYPEGLLKFFHSMNWINDSFKALLVKGSSPYSPSVNHKFISDLGSDFELEVDGYSRITVLNKQLALSFSKKEIFLKCNDLNFGVLSPSPVNVDHSVKAIILYRMVGPDDSSPGDDDLLLYYDGKVSVTLAADAMAGSTKIYVDPIPYIIAPGTMLSFIDGSTNASCTVSDFAGPNARFLNLSQPLTSSISAGITSNEFNIASAGAKYPFTVGGGNVICSVSANGILRLKTS